MARRRAHEPVPSSRRAGSRRHHLRPHRSLLLSSSLPLAVDLGNAWHAEARASRSDTDLATLAGAGIAGRRPASHRPVATCAYDSYAAQGQRRPTRPVEGHVAGEPGASSSGRPVQTRHDSPTQLTDCNVTNGEVFYGIPNVGGRRKLDADLQQEPAVADLARPSTWTTASPGSSASTASTCTACRPSRSARRSCARCRSTRSPGATTARRRCSSPTTVTRPTRSCCTLPDDTERGTADQRSRPVVLPGRAHWPAPEPLDINGSGFDGVTADRVLRVRATPSTVRRRSR